jgi:signal transduction histidine kinase
LLRNSIKHNNVSWKINIILDKNKLTILNTWNWINEKDLPHIFDRFFKWEKGRNTEGFWIWLSLVKKICDIYSWKILVKSGDNEETIFEIKF